MALAIVQIASQDVTAATTATATFSAGISSGSVIVAALTMGAVLSNLSQLTISDGAADTVTDSGLGLIYDGSSTEAFIQGFLNPSAGVTTVTANWLAGGNANATLVIYEISGFTAGTAAFDQTSKLASQATSPISSGTTATLAQAAEFAAGLVSDYNGNVWTTIASGWTLDKSNALPFSGRFASIILSSTAGVAFTYATSAPLFGVGAIATVKGTVGGAAAITGTLAATEIADLAAFAGDVSGIDVTAVLAAIEAADMAGFIAGFTAPPVVYEQNIFRNDYGWTSGKRSLK